MKRVGNLMVRIADLDNLYWACHRACRGKLSRPDVKRFFDNLDENVNAMRYELLNGKATIGKYNTFVINDPKERVISSVPFKYRVLQHSIMNVCHHYLDCTLIDTTYASRLGKGVYAAIEKVKASFCRYKYSVKLDVRKFYDNIDHEVLKARLRRIFKDNDLLTLLDRIIDGYFVTPGKGLPIGNLTSQYFANLYLSDLDHLAKEELEVPVYVRYMDDIMLIGNDKIILKEAVVKMNKYVNDELKLQLKPPIFRDTIVGQNFLGYKILPNKTELTGRSKRRFRTKLMYAEKMLTKGIWLQSEYKEHVLPLLAFAQYADSWCFRKACLMNMGDNR